mgnify:CR=1 FL=1
MRYQNVSFKKRLNTDAIEKFFKIFPEEKRGRKNFKNKEILNSKTILYNQIFKKALKIKSNCLHTLTEKITKDEISILVSFYKKR